MTPNTQPDTPSAAYRRVTDSLGFELKVKIELGSFDFRGKHIVYEDYETKIVPADAEHTICINRGLIGAELVEVVSHECKHLFDSIQHLITADDETEAVVFGQLVKYIFEICSPPPEAMANPVAWTSAAEMYGMVQLRDTEPGYGDYQVTLRPAKEEGDLPLYGHPHATDAMLPQSGLYDVLRMAREALELALSMTCSCGACDVNYRNKVREAIAAMDAKIKPAAGSTE